MIITLNSFWGRLFISISSSFSEVLSCAFIWNIFLALILLKSLCLLGFPCGSAGKESTCNAGDLSSIPGLGRYPREGKGYPLQYSGLEISMDCIMYSSWSCKKLDTTEQLSLCLLVYIMQVGYIS